MLFRYEIETNNLHINNYNPLYDERMSNPEAEYGCGPMSNAAWLDTIAQIHRRHDITEQINAQYDVLHAVKCLMDEAEITDGYQLEDLLNTDYDNIPNYIRNDRILSESYAILRFTRHCTVDLSEATMMESSRDHISHTITLYKTLIKELT